MTKCCGHERFGAYCQTCGKALPEHVAPLEELITWLRNEQHRLSMFAWADTPETSIETRHSNAIAKEQHWARFLSWANQIERVIAEQKQEPAADCVRSMFARKRA